MRSPPSSGQPYPSPAGCHDVDPQERREVVLAEIRRWRAEGVLDEDTGRFLESRYDGPGAATVGTPPLLPPPYAAGHRARRGGGFAADSLQFVGGLLLGAAVIALVVFLDVPETARAWWLLALGALALAGGLALHHRAPARSGLAEAMLAAGLIPIAAAGLFAGDAATRGVAGGLLAAGLGAATHVLRKGDGPAILIAGFAYVLGTFTASQIQIIFGEPHLTGAILWLLAILAYVGLVLVWRDRGWSTIGLALLMAPAALSFLFVLGAMGVEESLTYELALAGWMGLFLGLGILLRNRGLVAGSAAALTIDAVVFATDVGGPGTAVVVLLVLGGLLVWQAEFLRAWFKGQPPHG